MNISKHDQVVVLEELGKVSNILFDYQVIIYIKMIVIIGTRSIEWAVLEIRGTPPKENKLILSLQFGNSRA